MFFVMFSCGQSLMLMLCVVVDATGHVLPDQPAIPVRLIPCRVLTREEILELEQVKNKDQLRLLLLQDWRIDGTYSCNNAIADPHQHQPCTIEARSESELERSIFEMLKVEEMESYIARHSTKDANEHLAVLQHLRRIMAREYQPQAKAQEQVPLLQTRMEMGTSVNTNGNNAATVTAAQPSFADPPTPTPSVTATSTATDTDPITQQLQ